MRSDQQAHDEGGGPVVVGVERQQEQDQPKAQEVDNNDDEYGKQVSSVHETPYEKDAAPGAGER
jgi:hypothetical protein